MSEKPRKTAAFSQIPLVFAGLVTVFAARLSRRGLGHSGLRLSRGRCALLAPQRL